MHLSALLLLVSVLSPARTWFAPNEPVLVNVNPGTPARLVLMDFNGSALPPSESVEVSEQKSIDVAKLYPQFANGGYGVLFLVPMGKKPSEFIGTPLVLEAIPDKGGKPGPVAIKAQPLQFALMQTKAGPMTMIFYYDVAHHTVDSFLHLAEQGFYDNLLFHRIVPGFVIQAGDPRGDGSGGPGYTLPAEFNDKPHLEGVLSMARIGDPNEKYGRCPVANTPTAPAASFSFVWITAGPERSITSTLPSGGWYRGWTQWPRSPPLQSLMKPPENRKRLR